LLIYLYKFEYEYWPGAPEPYLDWFVYEFIEIAIHRSSWRTQFWIYHCIVYYRML
jgi:hypothetical protein